MEYLPNIIFAIILVLGLGFFTKNVKKLLRNIKLGQDVDVSDNKSQRWKNMAMIALGQSKIVRRPISGFLHVIVYVGFVIINIEVLEIIIDGNGVITSYTFHPFVQEKSGDNFKILPISKVSDKLKIKIEDRLKVVFE